MVKAIKGGQFEREICKQLSLWWTNDVRDDIFWRTSSSGARATQRTKQNKTTFGQYGDVQATDPIGQRLMDIVCIELKRGYRKASFSDWFDKKLRKSKTNVEDKNSIVSFIRQAERQALNADNDTDIKHGWWLILRRDRRETMLFMDENEWEWIKERIDPIGEPLISLMTMKLRGLSTVYQMPLQDFFENVPPEIFAKNYKP